MRGMQSQTQDDASTMTERDKFNAYWQSKECRQQADTHEERAWLTWQYLMERREREKASNRLTFTE